MLRCVQLGLSIQDLDLLTIGMVEEMMIESQNDSYPYKQLPYPASIRRSRTPSPS